MPLGKRDVESALMQKGFVYRGGDHRFYFFQHETLTRAVFTKVSHGSKPKTINDRLVGRMARQLHLTTSQFRDLVKCDMSHADYIQVLQGRGLIE